MRKDKEQLKVEVNEAIERHQAHYYGTDEHGEPLTERMSDADILKALGR